MDPSASNVVPPLHLPPKGKLLASGVGVSCATFCQKRGGLFVSEDLVFTGTFESLAKELECTACEAGGGAEAPAKVLARQCPLYGTRHFYRDSRCTSPSCNAARGDLQRLCVCRPNRRSEMAALTE